MRRASFQLRMWALSLVIRGANGLPETGLTGSKRSHSGLDPTGLDRREQSIAQLDYRTTKASISIYRTVAVGSFCPVTVTSRVWRRGAMLRKILRDCQRIAGL